MKFFWTFLLLFGWVGSVLQAQSYDLTVTGFVSEMGTPLEGFPVEILIDSTTDMNFTYENTVFTDESGSFEDVINIPDVGIVGMGSATIADCNGNSIIYFFGFSSSENTITLDFEYCEENVIDTTCIAMFDYTYSEVPFEINFFNGSSEYTSVLWDFGDGNTSAEDNPVHLFPAEGEYLVSLTMENTELDCSDTFANIVYVGDSVIGNDCFASFNHVHEGQNTLTFVALPGIDNEASFVWDFGDGNTGAGYTVTHTYDSDTSEMIYPVCLTATFEMDGDETCTSVYCEDVVVNEVVEDSCYAYFNYEILNEESTEIQFYNLSMGGQEWLWDFGDGNTSAEFGPVHMYEEPGVYEVTLEISNEATGCMSLYSDIISTTNDTINCPEAYFEATLTDSALGGTYAFINLSEGEYDELLWDFGDGNISTEEAPVHAYSEVGNYLACLTLTTENCVSTYCRFLPEYDSVPCMAFIEYEETDENTYEFTAYLGENNNPTAYEWDFGDGNTGSGAVVSHTYAEDGLYTVSVVITAEECVATTSVQLNVGAPPSLVVSGRVYLDDENGSTADIGAVTAYQLDDDTDELVFFDETNIIGDGYFSFVDWPEDISVYLKAELSDESAYYMDYAPTYYISEYSWEDAQLINTSVDSGYHDIYMLPIQEMSAGSGQISGTVSEEISRDMLSDVEILLMNANMQIVDFTYTDNNGSFTFDQLEMGQYYVHAEMINIRADLMSVSLSEDQPEVIMDIEIRDGEAALSLGELSSIFIDNIGALYPNPSFNEARLDIAMKESSSLQIQIINQLGQTVSEERVQLSAGTHQLSLDVENLEKGFYVVRLTTEDQVSLTRKMLRQ